MRFLSRGAAILLPFAALLGCTKPPAARTESPPAPVMIATAAKKTVPVRLRSIGTVKVLATVNIRPRVGGELTEVHFKEGEYVKKGQKLFTIDPRPYEAALKQAEASMARDKALLAGAELELKRIERGSASGVISFAELDAARTSVASAEATVAADAAAVHSSKLQLGFTTITSPIDGRTGNVLVTPGNLVSATEITSLVVVNQISPIAVAFTLPEGRLPEVLEAREKQPLPVEADLRGGGPLAVGRLAFIDNTVDPGTGTVQFKAEFPNADRRLWPGQFVDVVLRLGHRPDSVTIPAVAVQSGQQGLYVFVISAEKKAEVRPVTVAFEVDGEAVITSGLTGGETVVTEGQLRLAPGSRVEVKPAKGEATATAGGGK